jgi:RNA polymerase sigma factor (sigma-70 family)
MKSEIFPKFLEAIENGDDQAAMQVLFAYKERICRIVRHRLRSNVLQRCLDSSDLWQSAALRLLGDWKEGNVVFRTEAELVAWLSRVVRNLIASAGRAPRNQMLDLATNNHRAPQAPDEAKAAEIRDLLRHVHGQLDQPDRTMLELQLAGLTQKDLAERLGVSVSTVQRRLYEIRRRLRDALRGGNQVQ